MHDLPEHIEIGPYRFEVRGDEASYNAMQVEDKVPLWGKIDYDTGRITMTPKLPLAERQVTLLHEVLHGCCHLGRDGEDGEERFVRAIAASLLDTLRRNPALVAYLLDRDA